MYLYRQMSLSYIKHVKKFKPGENSEIGVLLKLSSHELYSQDKIWDSNTIISVEWKIIVFLKFSIFLLNDIVTELVFGMGHH